MMGRGTVYKLGKKMALLVGTLLVAMLLGDGAGIPTQGELTFLTFKTPIPGPWTPKWRSEVDIVASLGFRCSALTIRFYTLFLEYWATFRVNMPVLQFLRLSAGELSLADFWQSRRCASALTHDCIASHHYTCIWGAQRRI